MPFRERVPGAVAGDRPPDREAGPGHETDCARCRRRGRRGRDAGARPPRRAQRDDDARAATTTAAVPSGAVAPVPEAPPAKSAHARSTATPTENGRRRPTASRRGAASMARPRYHQRDAAGSGGQDLQFVYPALTTGSMAAGRLADTPRHLGTRHDRFVLSIPHLSSRPAPRPCRSSTLVMRVRRRRQGRRWRRRTRRLVRRPGDRRLVRRRARRQDLPARVLSAGDQEAAARRARLLEREGGDRPRARFREAGQARPGRHRIRRRSDDDATRPRPTRRPDDHGHDGDDDPDDEDDADDDRRLTTGTTTTDTSGPSSVPMPLLVLGGLAVLLLAAGSAGYLRRRMSGGGDGRRHASRRRVDGPRAGKLSRRAELVLFLQIAGKCGFRPGITGRGHRPTHLLASRIPPSATAGRRSIFSESTDGREAGMATTKATPRHDGHSGGRPARRTST